MTQTNKDGYNTETLPQNKPENQVVRAEYAMQSTTRCPDQHIQTEENGQYFVEEIFQYMH